jgi:hypothetical protein
MSRNWDTDISPVEQLEEQRMCRLSSRLEQLEIDAFSDKQLQAMLKLAGLRRDEHEVRDAVLKSLEKSFRHPKKRKTR